MALIFNKNIVKLGDNKEYIKKAVNIIAILCINKYYSNTLYKIRM